jgi:bacterioferritin
MREQAQESMVHAQAVGEWVTTLGGHPSLKIGALLETHRHSIDDILTEVLEHEKQGTTILHELLPLVEGRHVALEEFVRTMILEEETHLSEVEKMIRRPGDLTPAR